MAKFKVGERARIKPNTQCGPGMERYLGKEVTITSPLRPRLDACFVCGATEYYYLDIGCGACNCALQKLLPDSDTYHPADISIDDLMQSVRTREVA